MRIRNFAIFAALVAFSAGSAMAGEWRGKVEAVDRQNNTLEVGGQTIHVAPEMMAKVIEGTRYVVRWDEVNGVDQATTITQDDS